MTIKNPRRIMSGYMLDGVELFEGSLINLSFTDGGTRPFEVMSLEDMQAGYNGWYAVLLDGLGQTRLALSAINGVTKKEEKSE